MSGSNKFNRIAVIIAVITLVVTVLFMFGSRLGIQEADHVMGYESKLFDNTKVHTIDITMDNWDEFIENAANEEYYSADLVIDGEKYNNIAIRAKGNTSLSTVAELGSDRYSFKLEFDHYDEGVKYHGLDKLSLNNLIQDSTMMKDFLTYTMMKEFGAISPLCSYVYITVNGEDWGLYLAVEGVEDSFLERNYGNDTGELYKPDSLSFGGGKGNGKDFDMSELEDGEAPEGFDPSTMTPPENGEAPEGFDPSTMTPPENDETSDSPNNPFAFGGGGFGSSAEDVRLKYIDDDLDSYTNIWNNAKTDVQKKDKKRLVSSIKKLNEYEDLESVVDTEAVLRYFVVHNYVCNNDSYTGTMCHNYYLYEKDGQMSMIPWDYNLAFGTFNGGSADSTVNTPIDSPLQNGDGDVRPMWNWVTSDEEYTQKYHEYFEDFLENVDIQGIIDDTYEMIAPYVEKDPTAFYTYEEFQKGVDTLKTFCSLRSESITQQLANGQTTKNMKYVDGSVINTSDMGSMNSDKGGGMPSFGGPSQDESADSAEGDAAADDGQSEAADAGGNAAADSGQSETESARADTDAVSSATAQAQGQPPANGDAGAFGGAQQSPPNDFAPSTAGGGQGKPPTDQDGASFTPPTQDGSTFTPPAQDGGSSDANAEEGTEADSENTDDQNSGNGDSAADESSTMQKPDGSFSMDGSTSSMPSPTALIMILISVIVLIAGLIFARVYGRRR